MSIVIYRDISVPIKRKMSYCRKFYGKRYFGFIDTYGEVPVCRFNDITKQIEPVVNNRGRAYAARNRLQHRKRVKSYE